MAISIASFSAGIIEHPAVRNTKAIVNGVIFIFLSNGLTWLLF